MRKIIITLLFICSIHVIAQDSTELKDEKKSNSNLNFSVDLQSRYIWRGLQLGGNGPSAQPSIELSLGKFAIGAWGAYSLGGINAVQEADLYLTYSPLEFLSITLTDYFFPTEGLLNNYFEYGETTGHVYEAMVSFSGVEGFPIGFTVATNFAGADKKADGDMSFSTYVEASYSKTFSDVEYNVFAGAVLGDEGSYYGTTGTGFINLGLGVSKELKITDSFSLPVNTALIFNPDQENIYLTFGLSL